MSSRGAVTTVLRRTAAMLHRFRMDARGVSAIEFAFIAPFMLLIFFGLYDVFNIVTAKRKVTITARTLSDIISQASKIGNSDVTNALNASQQIIAPFPVSATTPNQNVSEILIDKDGNGTVIWNQSNNQPKYTPGKPFPGGSLLNLNPTGQSIYVILGEVTYTYQPATSAVLKASMDLSDSFFTRPRQSTCVQFYNGTTTLPASC